METEETNTSDDALNQAAEQAAETSPKPEETVSETTTETKTEIQKSDEETDQQFRSRLGRRVSRLEDNITSFMNEMRSTVQTLNVAQPASNNSDTTSTEYISTRDDVKRIVSEVEAEKLNQIRSYEDSYLNHIARLSLEEGLSDAEITKCEELIKTSFNKTYSNHRNPIADAEANFQKAMRVIDKGRSTPKTVNLKGDTPKGAGVNINTKTDSEPIPEIKLDKYAQDLVNYYKMPPDKVAKAFKEKV